MREIQFRLECDVWRGKIWWNSVRSRSLIRPIELTLTREMGFKLIKRASKAFIFHDIPLSLSTLAPSSSSCYGANGAYMRVTRRNKKCEASNDCESLSPVLLYSAFNRLWHYYLFIAPLCCLYYVGSRAHGKLSFLVLSRRECIIIERARYQDLCERSIVRHFGKVD